MPTLDQLDRPLSCPVTERLLRRGRVSGQPGHDLESVVCALFGIPAGSEHNLPVAAYRRLGDGGAVDQRYWLQLTPVYLRPDQDRLLLFDAQDLDLTREEAQALAELFNSHFAEEGWQVEVRDPHRWYLPLDAAPHLRTYELADVFGRNMDLFLPEGDDGIRWHGILNEIQMLFYGAEVNDRREQAGKGPISGLWLSGGGRLTPGLRSGLTAVYGDTPLLRGLAAAAKTPLHPLPAQPTGLLDQDGERLVCYERLQRAVLCADPDDWSEQLRGFEVWVDPLLQAIRNRRLKTLQLYPCNGQRYQIDRSALRRFWKRRRPIREWLDSNPTGG